MKENLQQSLRRIKILEDRVDQLCKVKRKNEAIIKCKKLFHLSTSFTVILLLNENFELFEELLAVSMRSWDTLMRLHVNHTFNLHWKKQVLAFELLAFLHAQKKKFKTGLKAIYEAQTIVSELDETIERNLDYIMSVNTLTGFLLLSINKPQEALEFILIAERIVYKLVEMNKKERVRQSHIAESQAQMTSLEIIGEQRIEENQSAAPITVGSMDNIDAQRINHQRKIFGVAKHSGHSADERQFQTQRLTQPPVALNQNSAEGLQELVGKRSCLSPTLLSNYVLGISLLKNIAMKYANPESFESNFETYMSHIRQVEQSLFKLGSVDCMPDPNDPSADFEDRVTEQLFNGVAVSFLIKQHKIEILDNEELSFQDLASETFNKEFMNMLQVCIFVPFLHLETPKPTNVPKVAALKENLVPHADLIKEVLNFRLKIGAVQKAKEQERRERQQMHEFELQKQAQSVGNSSVIVGPQLSLQHDGPDVIGIFDESSITVSQNQQPQTFAMAQSARGPMVPKIKSKRGSRSTKEQKRTSITQDQRGMNVGVPKVNDINEFASLVDPRHGSQKRRFKISQDRGPIRAAGQSSIHNSPKPIQRRLGSVQHNQTSVQEPKTASLEINKMESNVSSVKRGTPVIKDARMSLTLQNDNRNKTSWAKPPSDIKPITQNVSLYANTQTERFPNLQPFRTVTADNATQKSQSQTRSRPRRTYGYGYGGNPPTGVGLRDWQSNNRPIEQLLAEQRAADDRMRKFVQGARQHDENIEKILTKNKNDWSSLYSHPKLMGQYYWKDDAIYTNKQRAAEIKNVISGGYDLHSARGRKYEGIQSSLLQPLERKSIGNQK